MSAPFVGSPHSVHLAGPDEVPIKPFGHPPGCRVVGLVQFWRLVSTAAKAAVWAEGRSVKANGTGVAIGAGCRAETVTDVAWKTSDAAKASTC